jgi:hypothetical protein
MQSRIAVISAELSFDQWPVLVCRLPESTVPQNSYG